MSFCGGFLLGLGCQPPPFPFPFSGRTRALKVGTWHLVGNTEAWEHGSWSVCQAFQFLLLQTEAGAGLLLTCSWSGVASICGSKLQEALTIFLGFHLSLYLGRPTFPGHVCQSSIPQITSSQGVAPGGGSGRFIQEGWQMMVSRKTF